MPELPVPPHQTILHLSASPRGTQGNSHQLSKHVVDCLLARHPGAEVRLRMLGELGHVDAEYALALAQRRISPGADGALAVSDRLIEELALADAVVIGTPMHNLTVPSSLKAWIDHVVRIERTLRSTAQGKVGMLADRPVYLAISSGGWRTGEGTRQPDFLEPYLRAVLGTMGLHTITVFSLEGTSSGAEAAPARARAWATVDRYFASAG